MTSFRPTSAAIQPTAEVAAIAALATCTLDHPIMPLATTASVAAGRATQLAAPLALVRQTSARMSTTVARAATGVAQTPCARMALAGVFRQRSETAMGHGQMDARYFSFPSA